VNETNYHSQTTAVIWVITGFLFFGLAAGCQQQTSATQDREALKKEIEKLNQQRQKEWQQPKR
jgi:cell division protein FtsB